MKPTVLCAFVIVGACVAFGARAELTAHADLIGRDHRQIGTAILSEQPGGVKIHLEVKGLPPGPHAVHIHVGTRCTPPFATAGAHFNPDNHQHGVENPGGAHMGDLPNLVVGRDGATTVDLFVKGANLNLGPSEGVPENPGPYTLIAAPGTSIIIDAKPDDNRTDPEGHSGDHIACGGVRTG